MIQVSHPTQRTSHTYQFARTPVDDELQLPVYCGAYDSPNEDGGPPRLLEEYTSTDIKRHVGLSDHDFDHRHEADHLLKTFEQR